MDQTQRRRAGALGRLRSTRGRGADSFSTDKKAGQPSDEEAWENLRIAKELTDNWESDNVAHVLDSRRALIAKELIAVAEEAAKDSKTWRLCAKVWKKALADEKQARRCLAKAEELAKKSDDCDGWCQCAAGWKSVIGDEGQARRCVAKAEELAKGGCDWIGLTATWEVLGDEGEARRCSDTVHRMLK